MSIEVIPTGAAIGAEIRGVNLANPSTTPPSPQLRTPTTPAALSSSAIRDLLRRNRSRSPAASARSNSIYSGNAGACPATRRSLSSPTSLRKIVRLGSAVPERIGTATCATRRGRHAVRCFTRSRSPSYIASSWATQSLPVRRRPGKHYLTRSETGLKGGVLSSISLVASAPFLQEEIDRNPPVMHSMVRTNPYTGKKCLYIMRDDRIDRRAVPEDGSSRSRARVRGARPASAPVGRETPLRRCYA